MYTIIKNYIEDHDEHIDLSNISPEEFPTLTDEIEINPDYDYLLCLDDDNILYYIISIDKSLCDYDIEYILIDLMNSYGCTIFYEWNVSIGWRLI